MIYEYAVEPEMLLDAECGEFLASNFGIPRARLVAAFPDHWDSLVHTAIAEARPIAKHRIMEALSRLTGRMIPRKCDWDDADESPWLEKAEDEHVIRPFQAILASDNPTGNKQVLRRDDLHEGNALWNVEVQRSVGRSAIEMAACAGVLLGCAREVYFVDPHFTPTVARYRRPLETFLEILASRNNGVRLAGVELHVEAKGSEEFMRGERTEYTGRFAGNVPRGISLRVFRWNEDPKFHNRYILTDRGGIAFGHGLDEGEGSDDVSLLSDDVHRQRREQFQRNTTPFILVDQFDVVGRK